MMTKYPTLAIILLIANMVVLVAIGHGIMPLGILVWFVPLALMQKGSMILVHLYLTIALILSMGGQILLFLNIFLKIQRLFFFSLFILMVGLIFLFYGLNVTNNPEEVAISPTIYTSIPFLMLSAVYITKYLMERKEDLN